MKILPPIILPPVSVLYRAVVQTRRALYDRKFFTTNKLDAFVVSVGNITTGGTGKTPLVESLARCLTIEGRKVCILTRGYRRKNPDRRVLVSNGSELLATAEEGGDEAFLLANNLKGISSVICDADRSSAGKWAIEELKVDTFVLDDGFQHLRLHRDLDIVTIDATNPWGGDRLLPFGRLREPLSSLSRANCIVLTRTDLVNDLHEIRARLQQLAPCPVFVSRMALNGVSPISDTYKISEAENPVVAFCGIGNPSAFLKQLDQAGYAVARSHKFRDHHHYSQADVEFLNDMAREVGAKSLITTAKDAVKLRSFNFRVPCWSLNIRIDIDDDVQFREMIRSSIAKSVATE
jgi:tetraacyldisaccharide 4'-kinase